MKEGVLRVIPKDTKLKPALQKVSKNKAIIYLVLKLLTPYLTPRRHPLLQLKTILHWLIIRIKLLDLLR